MTDAQKPVFSVPGVEALGKIRMGPGVVGRTSFVVIGFIVFALVAVTAAAWLTASVWVVVGIFVVVAILVAAYIGAAFWYATKLPNHAVMDGAEYVRFAEIEQNANNPKIIDHEAQPVANTSAPKLSGPADA